MDDGVFKQLDDASFPPPPPPPPPLPPKTSADSTARAADPGEPVERFSWDIPKTFSRPCLRANGRVFYFIIILFSRPPPSRDFDDLREKRANRPIVRIAWNFTVRHSIRLALIAVC